MIGCSLSPQWRASCALAVPWSSSMWTLAVRETSSGGSTSALHCDWSASPSPEQPLPAPTTTLIFTTRLSLTKRASSTKRFLAPLFHLPTTIELSLTAIMPGVRKSQPAQVCHPGTIVKAQHTFTVKAFCPCPVDSMLFTF